MKLMSLTHEFVESFPSELQDGKIYVSITYATAAHRCCCGCGQKVITPISRSSKAWRLTYDGESISLHPSIGNWNFACQSHYWIKNDTVKWIKDVDVATTHDMVVKDKSDETMAKSTTENTNQIAEPIQAKQKNNFWQSLRKLKWW